MPRPKDYYRIDLPAKAYQQYSGDCPYTFELPVYSNYTEAGGRENEKCRGNIEFPSLHAKIHLTYKQVNNDIATFLEDSRKLSYKHSVKASGIQEFIINEPQQKVYGTIYEIGGSAASAIQFHVTDSSNHFLRGALYFYASPNPDSLAPVLSFVRKDIEHMLKTFKWK